MCETVSTWCVCVCCFRLKFRYCQSYLHSFRPGLRKATTMAFWAEARVHKSWRSPRTRAQWPFKLYFQLDTLGTFEAQELASRHLLTWKPIISGFTLTDGFVIWSLGLKEEFPAKMDVDYPGIFWTHPIFQNLTLARMPPNIQHCLRPCHHPSQQRLKLLCLRGIQSWLTRWSKIVPYTLEAEWVSFRILSMVTTTRLWVCVCMYVYIYRVSTCLSHAIQASHACNSPWARATRVQPNLARGAVASFIGPKMLI